MLAEAAGPDQRPAKKMRPGHCTKKFHPVSPGVTFLGSDTSFAQSHPPLLEKYLIEDFCTPSKSSGGVDLSISAEVDWSNNLRKCSLNSFYETVRL